MGYTLAKDFQPPESPCAARASGVPAWEVRHRYDHQGRRFERQERLDGEAVETRRCVHQGWTERGSAEMATPQASPSRQRGPRRRAPLGRRRGNVVAEYTVSAGALTLDRSYTWGLDLAGSGAATGGVGALLQIQDHSNNPEPAGQASYDERGIYRPAWDGIGNLVALYKDGVEAAMYEYSPYGELLRSRGPYADHNPIRYGSKLADPLTGLIDFGKRHYSPSLARFITRDPLQEQGGLNLYRYAGNDPVNAIDVLGLALVDQPASNAFLATGGLSGNLSNGTSNSAGEGDLDLFELDAFTVHGANNINLDTHWTNIRTSYNPFLTSDARGMPVYDYKYTWHGASMAEIASIYEARQEAILRRAEMTFNSEAHEESKKKAERERGTRLEDEMPGDFWGADIDQGLGSQLEMKFRQDIIAHKKLTYNFVYADDIVELVASPGKKGALKMLKNLAKYYGNYEEKFEDRRPSLSEGTEHEYGAVPINANAVSETGPRKTILGYYTIDQGSWGNETISYTGSLRTGGGFIEDTISFDSRTLELSGIDVRMATSFFLVSSWTDINYE